MASVLMCLCVVNPSITDIQRLDLIRTIKAIHMVEGSGKLSAKPGDGGASWGPLQIGLKVVKDVNGRYGTAFTSPDRLDFRKSVEICVQYLMMYEPKGGAEQWARLWNGGPSWRTKTEKTDGYWAEVQGLMKGN